MIKTIKQNYFKNRLDLSFTIFYDLEFAYENFNTRNIVRLPNKNHIIKIKVIQAFFGV